MPITDSSNPAVVSSTNRLKELRKPDFFIVGAAKAGTTSLYNYLKLHPDVYFSPIKEPHFFSSDIRLEDMREDFKRNVKTDISDYLENNLGSPRHGAFVRDPNHYLQLFSKATTEKRVGESSVSYLYSKVAAAHIKEFNPEASVVIILREPVERAFSHYLMDLRIGYENDNFIDAVNADINKAVKGWGRSHLYVELGLYYEQVKRYFDVFGKEKVKVFLHDDFKKSPVAVLKELYDFLELNDRAGEIDFSIRHNKAELPKSRMLQRLEKTPFVQKILTDFVPASLRRKLKSRFYSTNNLPKLTIEDRNVLAHYFTEDIQKLAALLNRDLSAWLYHS